jgi:minichromosome maintenance protein 10
VYDVPVVGDWVTTAVVAERSPVRVSRAPVAVGPGEAREADDLDSTPTPLSPQLLPEIQNRRGEGKIQANPLPWRGVSMWA